MAGYAVVRIEAFVYPTQICGSVPLLAMFSAASNDWFYTSDTRTASQMAGAGYVAEGNVGFVLPVTQGKHSIIRC